MSSFRFGIKTHPTPRNSQVTGRELRHLLFSPHSSIVLLTVLHTVVHLGSAYTPLHFGLSFCNPWEQIRPPYISLKKTSLAFIWGSVACSTPSMYRDIGVLNFSKTPPRKFIPPCKFNCQNPYCMLNFWTERTQILHPGRPVDAKLPREKVKTSRKICLACHQAEIHL